MKSPLPVIHLASGLDVGGAEMMLLRLVTRLEGNHFSNTVISLTDQGTLGKQMQAMGIPVHALEMPRGRLTGGGLSMLRRLLLYHRPFILQTWMYHANLVGQLVGAVCRVPRILWSIRRSEATGGSISRRTLWTVRVGARLSHCPAVVIANSESGRLYHESVGYHPREWVVIPNGFDTHQFAPNDQSRRSVRAELNVPRDALLVGMVGRYDPAKDHETFLRAARNLRQQHPHVQFVLAGRDVDTKNRVLTNWIADCGLGPFVHLLGQRTDIPRLTAALDIACSSSASEGFSNVIGEAMACGIPCVVTDVGDSASIVGSAGIVVPPRDAAALAAGCSQLIRAGAGMREKLGQAARHRVKEHYTLTGAVDRYRRLYQAL